MNVPPSHSPSSYSSYPRRPPPPEMTRCSSNLPTAAGVRFNPETKVYLIPCHWEFEDSSRRDMWYSPREVEAVMGKDVKRTVRHMRRQQALQTEGRNEDDDEAVVCTRGLEHLRSSAHMEQRKINRDCALKAVFDEQRRQREQLQHKASLASSEEELRRASEFGSAWSRNQARRMGMADQSAAERILEEEASNTRRILERAMRLCDMPQQSFSRRGLLKSSCATTSRLSSSSSLVQDPRTTSSRATRSILAGAGKRAGAKNPFANQQREIEEALKALSSSSSPPFSPQRNGSNNENQGAAAAAGSANSRTMDVKKQQGSTAGTRLVFATMMRGGPRGSAGGARREEGM